MYVIYFAFFDFFVTRAQYFSFFVCLHFALYTLCSLYSSVISVCLLLSLDVSYHLEFLKSTFATFVEVFNCHGHQICVSRTFKRQIASFFVFESFPFDRNVHFRIFVYIYYLFITCRDTVSFFIRIV